MLIWELDYKEAEPLMSRTLLAKCFPVNDWVNVATYVHPRGLAPQDQFALRFVTAGTRSRTYIVVALYQNDTFYATPSTRYRRRRILPL